jgi:hypothetical protein
MFKVKQVHAYTDLEENKADHRFRHSLLFSAKTMESYRTSPISY